LPFNPKSKIQNVDLTMRLLHVWTVYPDYWKRFYAERPGLTSKSCAEQHEALNRDSFSQMGAWKDILPPLGYEVVEIHPNIKPEQQAWARERGVGFNEANWMGRIALEQVKAFAPEVVFLVDKWLPASWRERLRDECPSVRLVLGFCGAPFTSVSEFSGCDAVVACTSEFVDEFRRRGVRSHRLNHAFNSHVLDRIDLEVRQDIPLSFIGNIVRRPGYHLERERLLETVADRLPLQIFSPLGDLRPLADWLDMARRRGVYTIIKLLRGMGCGPERIQRMPVIGRAAGWTAWPMRQVNPRLRSHLRPPVYGLKMFQTLRRSVVALNSHIDVAGNSAANIRLFEATGVGSCLLTDSKPNLSELFEPDREVVAYRSAEECVEKARWLLDHPKARDEIAARGQQRTLREHTYRQRAAVLDEIIRAELNA
jgi:spore maturation protein CgeB